MTLLAGTQIGKFVIQRKLAEGGMAEIFLASSFGPEGFEKQVIIKRIRPGLADDRSFVDMFVSEARLASRLNHANIVQIFDFDRHEDTFYIAMEYVRGKSLAQAQQRAQEVVVPVRPVLAAQIAADVARGLSFAHRLTDRGQPLHIVHRDVTPQNILISYEGAVKLTDFGIAKAGTRASTVGMLKGKFAYMAPEQSRAEQVDARTDIFALGITLWEMLTGSRLFDGDTDLAVLRAVQERKVVPPEQLNPAVSADLSTIVMRCLEREAAKRFQTAHELERALMRHVVKSGEGAEDGDVAGWMRELFPVEALRTEGTVLQPTPLPARAELSEASAASPSFRGSRPAVPSAEATLRTGGQSTSAAGLYDSSMGLDSNSQARARATSQPTPLVPQDQLVEGGTTRAVIAPFATSRVVSLVALVAILSTLVTLAVVFFLPTNKAPPAPAPAAPPATATQLPAAVPVVVPPRPPPEPAPAAAPPQSTPPAEAPRPPAKVATKPVHRTPRTVASVPSPKASSEAPAPAPRLGTLVMTINPWGDVLIDGQSKGEQVGRVEFQLPAGSHQVEVRGPSNWGPKLITIQPNQSTSQAVSLK